MAQERNRDDEAWQWLFGRLDNAVERSDMLSSDDVADELGNRVTRYWLTHHGLPRNAADARLMIEFVMLVMLKAEDVSQRLPKPERN